MEELSIPAQYGQLKDKLNGYAWIKEDKFPKFYLKEDRFPSKYHKKFTKSTISWSGMLNIINTDNNQQNHNDALHSDVDSASLHPRW